MALRKIADLLTWKEASKNNSGQQNNWAINFKTTMTNSIKFKITHWSYAAFYYVAAATSQFRLSLLQNMSALQETALHDRVPLRPFPPQYPWARRFCRWLKTCTAFLWRCGQISSLASDPTHRTSADRSKSQRFLQAENNHPVTKRTVRKGCPLCGLDFRKVCCPSVWPENSICLQSDQSVGDIFCVNFCIQLLPTLLIRL